MNILDIILFVVFVCISTYLIVAYLQDRKRFPKEDKVRKDVRHTEED